MEVINKNYSEFGFSVRYTILEDKKIDWEVTNEDGDLLMTGKFDSKDFFKSKFTIVPSNIEENTYESLFYLYFENIKLACIDIVEDEGVEEIDEE